MSDRVIGGRYSLIREIGRGGMGLIWECFDQQLERRVALKLMTPDHISSQSARQRFEREARAIAQLRNEHVIHVYDYGIEAGAPYIVMELLEGEDLEARLRRQERLTVPATLALLQQIARGLEAAHAAKIVHRDLKPANIFIGRGESGEVVKLLDFGVVWTLKESSDDSRRQSAGLVGTPAYMSPEQVRGAAPNHQSDIWSLGVIAYRALTGAFPFTGDSLGDVMVSVCTDAFPLPSALAPWLGPAADRFFDRALAKAPAQRFQSARELVTAFAALGAAGRGPTKILVVDDEPDVPLLIKQRFRQQIRGGAYEFVFAGNGEAGLAELRLHPDVDVILADINMPVMDGLTFLGRVGEVCPLARTVIVSAYGDMNNIRCAMNHGALDFVTKPIDFRDLEITIEKTARHVGELRKNARSSDENSLLRMFMSPILVERIRALGPADALSGDELEGTVVHVEICQRGPGRAGEGKAAGGGADSKPGAPGRAPRGAPSAANPGLTFGAPGRAPRSAPSAPNPLRALNANFEVIVPDLLARGGVVDRFPGAAVVAVFHGRDHVARALDACAAIRSQIEVLGRRTGAQSPFAQGVTIGVGTGRLITGGIGSRALGRLGYAVLGPAVTTAAELTRSGAPGQILVDERVRAVAPKAFVFEPVGTSSLRGVEGPVGVSNLVRRDSGLALPTDETLTGDSTTLGASDAPCEARPGAPSDDAGQTALPGHRPSRRAL